MRSTSELTHMQSSPIQRRAGAGTLQPSRTLSTTARNVLPLSGVSSQGKSVIGGRAGAMAGEEQLCELCRKGAGRLSIWRIRGMSFVTAVRGVRDHAPRLVEQALDLRPVLVRVDAVADAGDLDFLSQ